MKVKKLIISLLLISCIFAFTACSNGTNATKFIFDENSTVKLTYTCEDEEKNFYAELTAEQSRNFILSLNKLSYSEVTNLKIDFAPSYDNLIIKINSETLALYDVTTILDYGGYFYYNGKLCKSEEKFSFLEPYLVERYPDIIPSNISFGVQYVKDGVGEKETCQIIKSVSQLNDYIATENLWFNDKVIAKYNDEYFENSFIVIFMKALSSGSFDFKVNDVNLHRGRLIINYKIIYPTTGYATCDMAYWYSFVELSNEYGAIKNVDLILVK